MIVTITFGSVTIGAYSSGYLIDKLKGFDFPEVNVDVADRGQYHGARLNSYSYGERLFTINGSIYGTSASNLETKRQALQKALDLHGGVQTMTLTTRGSLALQAEVIAIAKFGVEYKKGSMSFCDFMIQLVAPYPFLLSQVLNSEEVEPFSGGGFAIPFAIPFSMGVGGSGTTTVTNDGNARAFPIITINGPIENPSIQNSTTGETCSLNYTLSTSTDYIEIDTYNRTVMLNGVTNLRQYFSGDWITLASGDNSIKLTGSSTGADTGAIFSYRDHYLGL